jgi:uncharacterized delta-60 repeat protein
MTASIRLLLLAWLAAGAAWASTPEGGYDPGFGSGGRRLLGLGDGAQFGEDVLVLPDRSVHMAGTCETDFGGGIVRLSPCLARVEVDGNPAEWGNPGNGWALLSGLIGQDGTDQCLTGRTDVDNGGRAYVPIRCIGIPDLDLLVLDPAGSTIELTTSLAPLPGTEASETSLLAVKVRSDHRVWLLAFVVTPELRAGLRLERRLPDLTLDPAFGKGGRFVVTEPGVNLVPVGLVEDSSGKLVVLLRRTSPLNATLQHLVLRLLPDGTPDPGFGIDGWVEIQVGRMNEISALDVDDSGRILLAGYRIDPAELDQEVSIGRLTVTGAPDLSFGAPGSFEGTITLAMEDRLGFGRTDNARAIRALPDGSMIVGGETQRPGPPPTVFYFLLVRLDSNGQLVPGFGLGGINYGTFEGAPGLGSGDNARDIALDPTGHVVIAGFGFGTGPMPADFGVARLGLAAATVQELHADGFEDPPP